jgi:hypothetical protein
MPVSTMKDSSMSGQQPFPIIDTPNSHGMFMLGTATLYLCHMPMFTMQDHRYQVILRAHLDESSQAIYLADKGVHPAEAYNLINPDTSRFILPDIAGGKITSYPATVFRGYSNASGGTPGPQIIPNATVFVDQIVRYRPFNNDIPRPDHLTYVLFGDQNGAYLDHYIALDPDFQHLLQLAEIPAWLSPSQLAAGVEVSFLDLKSTPIGCASPLTEESYGVMFQGVDGTSETLKLGTNPTVWYSTGNLLNKADPCSPGLEPQALGKNIRGR